MTYSPQFKEQNNNNNINKKAKKKEARLLFYDYLAYSCWLLTITLMIKKNIFHNIKQKVVFNFNPIVII